MMSQKEFDAIMESINKYARISKKKIGNSALIYNSAEETIPQKVSRLENEVKTLKEIVQKLIEEMRRKNEHSS